MNLKEFRAVYPQADFIDEEDVEEIIREFNENEDYKENHMFDIDDVILFYQALYSGCGNITE